MATRHQVRESVIGLLYAFDMKNEQVGSSLDDFLEERKIRNQQKEFAITLYQGVMENLEDIDEEINSHLKEWQLDQVGNVERCILRLGAYEIIWGKIDKAVVINEAIELSKELCNDTSSRFINGVLDSIRMRKK